MRKTILFLFVAAGAAFFFSCATAPPAQPAVDLETAKSRADDALAKAKTAQADVAVKAEYDRAERAYNEAKGLEASAEAQAIEKYLECESTALAAYNAAIAKREEARKQLEKAKSDIKALEEAEGGR